MPPASNEEQFKFLISCIRHSNNGKVDFNLVANECGIVSKGAAAKRYERLMRAHNIGPNSSSAKPSASRLPKSEPRNRQLVASTASMAASDSAPLSKKRKTAQFLEEMAGGDDDEGYGGSLVKREGGNDYNPVKQEEATMGQSLNQMTLSDAAKLLQYYEDPSTTADDDLYSADGLGGVSGYDYPSAAGTYGMVSQIPQGYGLDAGINAQGVSAYGGMGMPSVPRSAGQGLQYQAMPQCSDKEGQSDSPLVLD